MACGRQLHAAQVRVIVVDAFIDAGEVLSLVLRQQGHEVRVIERAATAFTTFERYPPEAAVICIDDADGFALARCLRSDDRFRDVLLVAACVRAVVEVRGRAIEAGFDHVVSKLGLSSGVISLLEQREIKLDPRS